MKSLALGRLEKRLLLVDEEWRDLEEVLDKKLEELAYARTVVSEEEEADQVLEDVRWLFAREESEVDATATPSQTSKSMCTVM
jgi:hypothetical protein